MAKSANEKRIEQLETELQEFRQLFSMSLDLICIADINSSTFLKVNPAFKTILGYSKEELIGKLFSDFIHPDDIGPTQEIVEEKLRQGAKVINFDNRYRCKDGSYKWLSWVSHPNPEQGKTYAIARDVTYQKRIATKLGQSKKKYESLFHNAQAALFRTSIDGELIDINKRYADIAGYDNIEDCMAEYNPKNAWSDPETRGEFLKMIKKTGSVSDYETKIIRKDGSAVWILFSATIFLNHGYIEGSIVNISDRKRAEKQIQVLNNEMAIILENSPIGTAFLKDRVFIWLNRNFARLFGYEMEEMEGVSTKMCFPSQEAYEQLGTAVYPEVTLGRTYRGEWQMKRRDGSLFWCHVSGEAVNPDDLKEGSIWMLEDISERLAAEEYTFQQAQIMSQIHDSVISADMDGMITSWNKGSEKLFQYKRDQVIGHHVSLVYPVDSHEWFQNEVIPKLLENKILEMETTLIRKDGNVFDSMVSLSVLRDKNNEINGMIGYAIDITDRKEIERELIRSEQNMSSILNSTQDLVVKIDHNFRHIFANPALYAATDLSPEEYLGKTSEEIGMPDNLCFLWRKKYENVFQTGDTEVFEFILPTVNLGERIFQAVISPEYNENRKVELIISFMRDITDLKQVESEKIRVIEQLKKTLSEVKTLRGLIPICSKCKKISDDRGYWNVLEAYIEKHSDASFSHGMCQECSDELYGDEDWYIQMKNDREKKE